MTDEDVAIAYLALARGTEVVASDGTRVGSVRDVLDNKAEHIFDGLVLDTPDGQRFVDAPEVARITEKRVTLTIDAAAAAQLPERDPKGGATFVANTGRGRFGRLWRKR